MRGLSPEFPKGEEQSAGLPPRGTLLVNSVEIPSAREGRNYLPFSTVIPCIVHTTTWVL